MNIKKWFGIPTEGPVFELKKYKMTPEETARRNEIWRRLQENVRATNFKLPCRQTGVIYKEGEGYFCIDIEHLLCQSDDAEDFRCKVMRLAALNTAVSLDKKPDPGDAVAWTTAEFTGTAHIRAEFDPVRRRKTLCNIYELILKRMAIVVQGQPLRDFTAELEDMLNAEIGEPNMYFCVDKLKFENKE